MAVKTLKQKRIAREVELAFYAVGCNRQFNIMDLSKIHRAGEAAGERGEDIATEVAAACDQYAIKETA